MTAPAGNHRAIARLLCSWFRTAQRDLPWRVRACCSRRNPYHTLVSEFMLQQTHVSRVLEHFEPFIDRFPTIAVLARARPQTVLGMWSGLGYYRRAKNLHAAARVIHQEHDGLVPYDHDALLALPGVGRYTAGAIASLAFDEARPIVDGNISRVLLRLHGRCQSAADASAWTWDMATTLVHAAAECHLSAGDLNESLMELGATVCTPRSPTCSECPLKRFCAARKQGVQEVIPLPGKPTRRSAIYCASVVVTNPRGDVLLEQRPSGGLWADMWQTPTLERNDRPPTPEQLGEYLLGDIGSAGTLTSVGTFRHQTTRRIVHFTVYAATATAGRPADGRITKSPRALASVALSNAQRKVIKLVGINLAKPQARAKSTPTAISSRGRGIATDRSRV